MIIIPWWFSSSARSTREWVMIRESGELNWGSWSELCLMLLLMEVGVLKWVCWVSSGVERELVKWLMGVVVLQRREMLSGGSVVNSWLMGMR